MYTITLEMEDGQIITWIGDADDQDHAEGKAVANANERTGEQVKRLLKRTESRCTQRSHIN